MRVLLFADVCNPELGGEPLVGWNICRSIAEQVDDAVVVTPVRHRAAIERTGFTGAEFVYVDNEYLMRMFRRVARSGAAGRIFVRVFMAFHLEFTLWRRFKADIRAGRFDVLHRVTPVSSVVPSPIVSWSPVPVVLGPVNGGLPYPPQFQDVLHRDGESIRHLRAAWRLLPWAGATYRKAAAILAAFEHTIAKLPSGCRDRVVDMPENGADPARFTGTDRRTDDPGGQLTFLFVGRLVPFKCVDVAIDAFAGSETLRDHRLEIVGDGPERAALEAQVAAAGLGDCVNFVGRLPQEAVARRMAAADVFVFPSIRDSGAGVVVEAMMSGLPVVAMDYGPTRHWLSDDSGLRVPLGERKRHAPDVRAALERLVADPARRRALGAGARRRALALFSWQVRARKVVQVYEWVLGRRARKPVFYETEG